MIETFASLMTNSVEDITSNIRPAILKFLDEECYMIRPISSVGGLVVLNADMRNVSDKIITHSVNYYLEDIYFDR